MGLTQKLGTIPLAILTDSSNNVGIGAAASGSYKLQVTGTTNLTGALSGTSATFSTDLVVNGWLRPNSIYAFTADSATTYIQQPSGGNIVLRKSDSTPFLTIANTGAATFSSSVTAQLLAISNGYYLVGRNAANTAFRTLLTFDSSNKILIGQDSDITAITLGVASEAMRITSGGNVGIGTSSPNTLFEIAATTIGGAEYSAYTTNSNGGTSSKYSFWRNYTAGSSAAFRAGYIANSNQDDSFNSNNRQDLVFATKSGTAEPTVKMTITSGGTVLVNATSSTYGAASGYNLGVKGTSGQAFISIARTGQSLDSQGMILGLDTAAGQLTMIDNLPLTFATNNTERMRITSGGNTKATNQGSYYNSGTGLFHEFVQGTGNQDTMWIYNTASSGYGLTINMPNTAGNGTNYFLRALNSSSSYFLYSNGSSTFSSDRNLKKNIETTRNGYLEDLMNLRVVKYNWNTQEDGEAKELGLIAQEVAEIFPSLVVDQTIPKTRELEQEDGSIIEEEYEVTQKGLKISVLPFMLLKGLQEANTKIENLQSQIEELKALINK